MLCAVALQEQQLQQLHDEATRGLDAAEMEYLNQRTWKDLPQAELAERMSKGEICPRDEWIPGKALLHFGCCCSYLLLILLLLLLSLVCRC